VERARAHLALASMSNNELARRRGAFRAAGDADPQRAVCIGAKHHDVLLLTEVEQPQVWAAAPQPRLPCCVQVRRGTVQPMVHALDQPEQKLSAIDAMAARGAETGSSARDGRQIGDRRIDIYPDTNDDQQLVSIKARLAQDAGQFTIVQHEVVGPLDCCPHVEQDFNALGQCYRRETSPSERRWRATSLAEQERYQQGAARAGYPRAGLSAAAGALKIGSKDRPSRRSALGGS